MLELLTGVVAANHPDLAADCRLATPKSAANVTPGSRYEVDLASWKLLARHCVEDLPRAATHHRCGSYCTCKSPAIQCGNGSGVPAGGLGRQPNFGAHRLLRLERQSGRALFLGRKVRGHATGVATRIPKIDRGTSGLLLEEASSKRPPRRGRRRRRRFLALADT